MNHPSIYMLTVPLGSGSVLAGLKKTVIALSPEDALLRTKLSPCRDEINIEKVLPKRAWWSDIYQMSILIRYFFGVIQKEYPTYYVFKQHDGAVVFECLAWGILSAGDKAKRAGFDPNKLLISSPYSWNVNGAVKLTNSHLPYFLQLRYFRLIQKYIRVYHLYLAIRYWRARMA